MFPVVLFDMSHQKRTFNRVFQYIMCDCHVELFLYYVALLSFTFIPYINVDGSIRNRMSVKLNVKLLEGMDYSLVRVFFHFEPFKFTLIHWFLLLYSELRNPNVFYFLIIIISYLYIL